MLKKFFAPLLFTSVLIVAGCSSDEGSNDLEDVEDIEAGNVEEEDNSDNQGSENEDQNQNEESEDTSTDSPSESEGSTEESDSDNGNQSSEGTSNEGSSSDQQDGSAGSGGSDQQETGNETATNGNNNSSEKESTPSQQQYTFQEVNGDAVNVIQGLNAVEIKRQNISGATANTNITLKAGGKEVALTYNKERDSFRNYEIKEVELEQLKQATVVVQG